VVSGVNVVLHGFETFISRSPCPLRETGPAGQECGVTGKSGVVYT
jgi:hypothetical protein